MFHFIIDYLNHYANEKGEKTKNIIKKMYYPIQVLCALFAIVLIVNFIVFPFKLVDWFGYNLFVIMIAMLLSFVLSSSSWHYVMKEQELFEDVLDAVRYLRKEKNIS